MINTITEHTIWIVGTPNGILAIIMIGEVKGIIDSQYANPLWGWSITNWTKINDKISGIVIGKINCWLSVSWSETEPIAANNEP